MNYLFWHFLIFFLILLIFLMFSTCSSRPDAGDAEDDLSERIDAESNGTITLIEFEKTNAIERQAFGQESYTIQFKAKVRFEKECYIYLNKTGIGPLFTSFKTHLTKPEFIPNSPADHNTNLSKPKPKPA